MSEIPVTGAYADYRGTRFLILFGGPDWVALNVDESVEIPDAFDRGESSATPGQIEPWAKVPTAAIDGVTDVEATATLRGHSVSLRQRASGGRIRIWFVGPPAVAQELGLDGDQYMGWTGLFAPADFDDVHVEETRRA